MDWYEVKKKIKILKVYPTEKIMYASTQASHVGLYMWGKDVHDYIFYKNGFHVDLRNSISVDDIINILEND